MRTLNDDIRLEVDCALALALDSAHSTGDTSDVILCVTRDDNGSVFAHDIRIGTADGIRADLWDDILAVEIGPATTVDDTFVYSAGFRAALNGGAQ
jgi:hypothetical protein